MGSNDYEGNSKNNKYKQEDQETQEYLRSLAVQESCHSSTDLSFLPKHSALTLILKTLLKPLHGPHTHFLIKTTFIEKE